MKRTTVKLPDALDTKLRLESRRQGRSLSEIVRDAVAGYLAASDRRSPPGFLRLKFKGSGVPIDWENEDDLYRKAAKEIWEEDLRS